MNDLYDNNEWFEFLETPLRTHVPVKLDVIMAARLTAFMKAKKVRRAHFRRAR